MAVDSHSSEHLMPCLDHCMFEKQKSCNYASAWGLETEHVALAEQHTASTELDR